MKPAPLMQYDTQNIIPCNLEAEQIIIGSLIANNEYYHQIEEHIQEQYFYNDLNRKIFLEIKKFLEEDLGVSLNTILMALRDENKEEYKNENLTRYLIDILEMNEPVHNLKTYANLIYDCYLRRSLIDICRETIAENKEKEDILAAPETKAVSYTHLTLPTKP
jgi:replicative DNA helicase